MEYSKEELKEQFCDLAARLTRLQKFSDTQQEIIEKLTPRVTPIVYVLKEDYDESSYILGIYHNYDEALKHLQKVQETNNDDNVSQYLMQWNTITQSHQVVNGADADIDSAQRV